MIEYDGFFVRAKSHLFYKSYVMFLFNFNVFKCTIFILSFFLCLIQDDKKLSKPIIFSCLVPCDAEITFKHIFLTSIEEAHFSEASDIAELCCTAPESEHID